MGASDNIRLVKQRQTTEKTLSKWECTIYQHGTSVTFFANQRATARDKIETSDLNNCKTLLLRPSWSTVCGFSFTPTQLIAANIYFVSVCLHHPNIFYPIYTSFKLLHQYNCIASATVSSYNERNMRQRMRLTVSSVHEK